MFEKGDWLEVHQPGFPDTQVIGQCLSVFPCSETFVLVQVKDKTRSFPPHWCRLATEHEIMGVLPDD